MTIDADAFNIDEAIIAKLLLRTQERRLRGERPNLVTLPRAKGAFPKLLCLDLNKWVDLARAHYGKPGAHVFRPALEAIRAAVSRGRLVVPIAAANAREAMVPMNVERRRRLVEFMVELSGNHCLANDVDVIVREMDEAIWNLWLRPPLTPLVRERLVQRGVTAAIKGGLPVITGVDPETSTFLVDTLDEPEITILMLMNLLTPEEAKNKRQRANETASISMQIRQHTPNRSMEEQRRAASVSLFQGGLAREQLRELFTDQYATRDRFLSWLADDDNAVRFAAAVPGIDVMMTLILVRNRNPNHKTHSNDGEDFAFLRTALPYANIVVTENSWGHFARSSGLADRYGTVVISDLIDLPDTLTGATQ